MGDGGHVDAGSADDELMTTGHVQRILHVNSRTLYRLVRGGQLPAIRVGRQWRFRRADLDAWLAGHRQGLEAPVAAPASLDRPAGDPSAATRPVHVLVADPDLHASAEVASSLRTLGHTVVRVPDEEAARDELRSNRYDVLITEINARGLEGLSLVATARRQQPDLKVIILTAHSTESAAIQALNLGVTGYCTKPVDMMQLVTCLLSALRP